MGIAPAGAETVSGASYSLKSSVPLAPDEPLRDRCSRSGRGTPLAAT
jgi:hypothetical protein